MLLMRWQLAFPGEALTWANAHNHIMYQVDQILYHLGINPRPPTDPLPVAPDPNHPPFFEWLFGKDQMPGGVMTGDFYNTLGAMHGTIMVFFGIVPVAFAAFGNYVMPLQIGTVDMAFPRLNMGSVILFLHQRGSDDGQLLRSGRRGQVGLDLVHAARGRFPISHSITICT